MCIRICGGCGRIKVMAKDDRCKDCLETAEQTTPEEKKDEPLE